jgi:hypothetical protein|tara:strand:- start:590 stop:1615 length:1026 start_codon:yes stop_codon:yes gene_type:complete
MNIEQYTTYKEKYPNFDDEYVTEVPLDKIEISHIADQVRTAGEDKMHVRELHDQISRLGQLVPATGQELANGNTKLHAGQHRYNAQLLKQQETGIPQTLKVAKGFSEIDFRSEEERVIWQLNENTELATKNCDTDDYVESLTGLIVDNHVLGTDLSKLTPEMLRKYIRKSIPNLTGYQIKKIGTSILTKSIFNGQRKFRNYPNKSNAADKFNEINPWGISVKKSGDSDMGWTIYFAESHTALAQNALHGAWHVKNKKDPDQTMLVVYCGNVLTKTHDIAKWRRDALKKFNEENTHPKFIGNIFDAIVFLPQALMGKNIEDQSKLINPLNFDICAEEEESMQ